MMLLALPQPGPPAGAAAVSAAGGRGGLELEHRAEAQAQQARAADAQQVAAGHAELRVAQVFACLSGDDDHRDCSLSRGTSVGLGLEIPGLP